MFKYLKKISFWAFVFCFPNFILFFGVIGEEGSYIFLYPIVSFFIVIILEKLIDISNSKFVKIILKFIQIIILVFLFLIFHIYMLAIAAITTISCINLF